MAGEPDAKRGSAQPKEQIVIIGGGVNGLVAGFYLAKAGFPTLILERRAILGGTLVTEQIAPGFHCPTVHHSTGPLPAAVVRDMQLDRHGFQTVRAESGIRVLALSPDGEPIRIYEDADRTASELLKTSEHDGHNYLKFNATFKQLGRAIAPVLSMTPPDIDHLAINDYLNLASLGLKFRSLDRKNAYRLLRWGPMAVADMASEWFEMELLRAVIEARGIWGAFAGPRSAGTSIGCLIQAACDGHAVAGASFVRGGIGAISTAMAKAALAAGARIRMNSSVTGIRVRNNEACGVVLDGGEEIAAKTIVCSADPKHTFLKLIEAPELDPSFLAKIHSYRATGTVAKVNLALSRLPDFRGIKDVKADLSGRIHIGPDTDYLEHAFDAAKYGDMSSEPYLDIVIPSLTDSSLAPAGAHVMSIYVQYVPYRLKSGDWNSHRSQLADTVVKTLSRYAPDTADTIVGRHVLTPVDLEETYGLTGGHLFHGEHALDQLFSFRPVLGSAQYGTPIKNLYLCGSGTHPGGGLSGHSGANASREIIRRLK